MKIAILLLSAAYTNGGAYVDAGETVPVGPDKNEITEERAADIVKGKRAEEVELPGDEGDGLDGETVPELKKIAADEDVDLGSATKKGDIIALIRAKREAAGDEG